MSRNKKNFESPLYSRMPSQQEIVNELCQLVGIMSDQNGGDVKITGSDPVVNSPHRLGDVTSAALATLGISIAGIWRNRTGEEQNIHVDINNAISQLGAIYYSRLNGLEIMSLLDDPGCWDTNDFYRTKDGRFVFIVNSLPRLREIASRVLNCPASHADYVKHVAKWNAHDLEEAIASRGGCCVVVRTAEEWAEHPQGKVISMQPVISLEKVGESAPVPFSEEPRNALSGIRVLDNTHVIAGPISGRIMAEFGADVFHISRPGYSDPTALTIETGIGKRNGYCRFDDPCDSVALHNMLSSTDVWVNSYMDLTKFGLDTRSLTEIYPGLITLDFSCFGNIGPWKDRGGFDQMAQSVTGFAIEEGEQNNPKLSPTYLINDYLSAILGTIGVTAALQQRAKEGGSWKVNISLARVCSWVRAQGLFTRSMLDNNKLAIPAPPAIKTIETSFGELNFFPTQVKLGRLEPILSHSVSPWGRDRLGW